MEKEASPTMIEGPTRLGNPQVSRTAARNEQIIAYLKDSGNVEEASRVFRLVPTRTIRRIQRDYVVGATGISHFQKQIDKLLRRPG